MSVFFVHSGPFNKQMKQLTNVIWGLLEVQIIDSMQHQQNEYMPLSLHCFNSLIGVAAVNTIRLSTSPSNLYLVATLKNNTSYLSNIRNMHNKRGCPFQWLYRCHMFYNFQRFRRGIFKIVMLSARPCIDILE